MRLRPVASLLAIAIAAAIPLAAQSPASAPDSVARAFFRAASDARWADAAGYLDLDGVDASRRSMVEMGRRAPRQMTVAEYRAMRPGMPRAVAEWEVAEMQRMTARHGEWIVHQYAGVSSADSLARLPVREVAARWLEAQSMGYQLRQALAMQRTTSGCKGVADSVSTAMSSAEPGYRVIGTVVDGDAAYVLHTTDYDRHLTDSIASRPTAADSVKATERARASEGLFTIAPSVLVLRRGTGGDWRIVATQNVLSGGFIGYSMDCSGTPASKKPARRSR